MSNRKNRLIPFSWTPAAWGLMGPARLEAEAAYYYSGYALEIELIKIRNRDKNKRDLAVLAAQREFDVISDYEYEMSLSNLNGEGEIEHLAIDLKYGAIDEYGHDVELAKLLNAEDTPEREIALLEVEFKHGKMGELEYEKTVATLKEEPWVGIVDQGFDLDKGLDGIYFEFDWNEYWIEFLRMNGYVGVADSDVVDQWFADVCRSQGVSAHNAYADGTVVPFSGRLMTTTED